MARYFSFDYTGDPFVLFGTAHLLTSLVFAALGFLLLRAGSRATPANRTQLRTWLAIFLLANELSWHVWNLAWGTWTLQKMLPLHLCSIMIWVTIYTFLFEKRSLYPLIYFLGVAGAVQAVITPDAGIYGFPHFRFFQTMNAHGGLVVAGLWVVFAEGYRPGFRDMVRTFVQLNVYALFVWIVNLIVGSNYLYMGGKPESASLMDMLPNWPWYVLILEVLALVLLAMLYVPFRKPQAATVTTR